MAGNELGEFLRARRAQVTPAEVDLPSVGQRRVSGLRREEVALLAGLSVDYYTRLEQGRERHPSAQVVDALAAALRLPEDGREHLFRLAALSPRVHTAAAAHVDPALLQLMSMWPHHPAIVYSRAYDVLASNQIADAMFSWWEHSTNLLHVVFTDPAARSFYADWAAVAEDAVAGFRHGYGQAPNDPRIRAVLAEVLEASPEFADLWTRHDARRKSLQSKRFRHPRVGEMTLTMQTFDVRSSPGQELVVYHAEAGSTSAEALSLLGSLAATETGR
ncbi:helix-turn-helix transcriptional regulator [Mycolicibacterium parafortuitum]|uniref:XRE family transcriptional regulator [Saccharopolyspora erythraea NRRL 2338] n=1 Tax=Mycolicibacterium parafortuitum TaxID=39692 RepID=A0A375YD06_MYCPF|nr:helix-turn-helix transcriptional regulator [Mycolicibacterium parafortuitum]ORB24976.1 transcriptional regulator [Mycolicibacterium parafortuitum]SRX78959.1 XRE family transcriptional regulator [Saccharopolyspora erythraea NRRL 2338] [Mycolicibacterium parafortuitum]